MAILKMSFSAAVLILAVVTIRAVVLHKLPKKTFLILWILVLCRLLIPFSIPSRFSVYTIADVLKARFLAADIFFTSAAVPDITVAGTVNPVSSDMASVNVPLVMAVWITGLLACALFFLVTHLHCRREYKTALPVDNEYVKNWEKEHPLRRKVEIRQSDKIAAPLTYGVLRPVVLLPKTMDWTDETRLRFVLTHEYVHIRQFDILLKWLLAAALCVHWFNPFVWVMYVLANRDIELSCDEAVVRIFGGRMKSAYALTLIGLEEKKSRLTPLENHFCKNAAEERIMAIMKMQKNSNMRTILSFILVAVITAAFATSADTAASEADVTPIEEADRAIIAQIEYGSFCNRADGSVTLGDGTDAKDLKSSGDAWMSISAGKTLDIGKATWGKGEQITLFVESERENELEVGIKSAATGAVYSEMLKSGTGKVIIPIPTDGEYKIYVKNNSRSGAKISVNYIVNVP